MDLIYASWGNTVGLVVAGALIAYFLYNFITTGKKLNKPASPNVKILTDSNFEETVGTGVSLVDFWAAWCQPCRVQGPIVDELANEMHSKANICKLNIDENKKIATKLGIRSIPTMMLFKNGRIAGKFVGVQSKHFLMNELNKQLG
ncbi:MAG: thioredoxin [Bacteroidales bacterium]|nr:thioredoxin [Bacteroidales bacterium]